MGRSVSTPHNALLVAFQHQDFADADDFEAFLDGVQYAAIDSWPSMAPADRWVGREDHVIAENAVAAIGVSEYCGLVSIWVIPNEDRETLAAGWAHQIETRFMEMFGQLRRIGVFSNGEAVFERV